MNSTSHDIIFITYYEHIFSSYIYQKANLELLRLHYLYNNPNKQEHEIDGLSPINIALLKLDCALKKFGEGIIPPCIPIDFHNKILDEYNVLDDVLMRYEAIFYILHDLLEPPEEQNIING